MPSLKGINMPRKVSLHLSELPFYADRRLCVSSSALWTGYALNIAIGLQVLLGALTTGLAAAVTGKQAGFIRVPC